MKILILMSKIFPPNSKTAQLKQIDPVTLVCNFLLYFIGTTIYVLTSMLLFILTMSNYSVFYFLTQGTFVWDIPEYSGICSSFSAPGSRIAGMEIQVFRNENSSQTNAYSHYSNYSYSGLIPNERALNNYRYQYFAQFLISLLKPPPIAKLLSAGQHKLHFLS